LKKHIKAREYKKEETSKTGSKKTFADYLDLYKDKSDATLRSYYHWKYDASVEKKADQMEPKAIWVGKSYRNDDNLICPKCNKQIHPVDEEYKDKDRYDSLYECETCGEWYYPLVQVDEKTDTAVEKTKWQASIKTAEQILTAKEEVEYKQYENKPPKLEITELEKPTAELAKLIDNIEDNQKTIDDIVGRVNKTTAEANEQIKKINDEKDKNIKQFRSEGKYEEFMENQKKLSKAIMDLRLSGEQAKKVAQINLRYKDRLIVLLQTIKDNPPSQKMQLDYLVGKIKELGEDGKRIMDSFGKYVNYHSEDPDVEKAIKDISLSDAFAAELQKIPVKEGSIKIAGIISWLKEVGNKIMNFVNGLISRGDTLLDSYENGLDTISEIQGALK
jgi:hypothetical protein